MSARAAMSVGLVIAALTVVAPAAAAPVEVSLTPERATARLGDGVTVRATVSNRGRTPLAGLVANLNVVSWNRDVYVDPEDWSSERTRYLAPLGAGRSVRIPWTVTPVNGGHFAVYVVVLDPRRGAAPPRPLAVGPNVDVRVVERNGLDSSGLVPLVLGVPGLLGLIWLGLRVRRRAGTHRSLARAVRASRRA